MAIFKKSRKASRRYSKKKYTKKVSKRKLKGGRRSGRRHRRQNGGAVVLPSEYFGVGSGRYSETNNQSSCSGQHAVSQGVFGIGATMAGPNLFPMGPN